MKKWQKWALSLVVIVGIFVAVKSCVDRKVPDITLCYIGDGFVQRDAFEKNAQALEDYVADINSDGEINIDLMEVSFNEQLGQADRQNSMQKMTNALGAGVARVYFIEEKYMINNADTGVFEDLSLLGDGFKNSEGKVVGMSIKDNEKAWMLGIDTDEDIYLAVRIVSEMDEVMDKSVWEKHKVAMNIAEYILN